MNERIVRMFLAAGTVFAMLGIPSLSHAATPDVIISEVAWAGSSVSTVDEWLELSNLTDQPVDIGNWTVAGAAASGGTLTIPAGSVIGPYSTFLISNYADDNAKSALSAKPGYVTTSVSLSNSALSLVLADANGVVHDAAGNGSAPLAGSVGGSGGGSAAMARRNPVSGGTQADAWAAADASNGFDADVTDLGSPGSLEAGFAPAAVAEAPVATTAPGVTDASEVATETIEPSVEPIEPSVEPIETPADLVEVPVEVPIGAIATEPEAVVVDVPANVEPALEETTEPAIVESEPVIAEETPAYEEPIVDATQTSVIETVDATDDSASTNSPEATADVEIASVETPTASAFAAGTLAINEFVSDATEEWIEIVNASGGDVSLSEWTVRDATGKATSLPELTLGAGQFAVIANPKGKLNNDGDTITLLDPSGAVIDQISYGTDAIPAPHKTESTALGADGAWKRTTTPTPGTENVLTETAVATDAEAVTETTGDATNSDQRTEVEPVATTATQTETGAEEPIGTVVPWSGPTTLRFSELYPNTSGDDATEEFIELENTGDAAVDLTGWQIADASGKTFTAKNETLVAPHALLALHRDVTKLTLNNDADSVTLVAPNGTVVDTRPYDHAKKGSSLVLVSAEWVWSGTPTPDEPNHVPTDAPAAVAATSRNGVSLSAGTIRRSLEGTVLVAPGVLGSQTFYVQTEDGGTQVYKNDGNFPDLAEGDVVRITGTETTVRGEPRLKLSKTDVVKIVSSGDPVVPEDMAIADLSKDDHGKLVRVLGTVVTRSGKAVTIENGADQLSVRVADGTDIDLTSLTKGKKFRVTGILTASTGRLTLLPRSQDDIEPLADATPVTALTAAPTGNQSAASRDAATAELITAGTGLALAGYSARKFGPKLLLWYAKARALRAAA